MILGAVLAGGRSSRFGSDKALALLGGRSLIDRAVAALRQWCAEVVVVGRDAAPARTIPDWPQPGLGPLGGVAAALREGERLGAASVLTVGVDSLRLPRNLPELLSPPPAYLEMQPVIGHWPANAASHAVAILQGAGRRSMLAFAAAAGARPVAGEVATANINTPADLAALGPGPWEHDDGI